MGETHGKWGAVSGLYRLDVGEGWSEEGDQLEVGKIWQTMLVGFRFRRSKPDPDPKSLKEMVKSKIWGK